MAYNFGSWDDVRSLTLQNSKVAEYMSKIVSTYGFRKKGIVYQTLYITGSGYFDDAGQETKKMDYVVQQLNDEQKRDLIYQINQALNSGSSDYISSDDIKTLNFSIEDLNKQTQEKELQRIYAEASPREQQNMLSAIGYANGSINTANTLLQKMPATTNVSNLFGNISNAMYRYDELEKNNSIISSLDWGNASLGQRVPNQSYTYRDYANTTKATLTNVMNSLKNFITTRISYITNTELKPDVAKNVISSLKSFIDKNQSKDLSKYGITISALNSLYNTLVNKYSASATGDTTQDIKARALSRQEQITSKLRGQSSGYINQSPTTTTATTTQQTTTQSTLPQSGLFSAIKTL